ncbi:hypothetical protein BDQ17DRAFT_1340319 [Cyathus striatus]|nr:hypothetical protein BDQ17DRAFT_1340319 [Cyathus striatus]
MPVISPSRAGRSLSAHDKYVQWSVRLTSSWFSLSTSFAYPPYAPALRSFYNVIHIYTANFLNGSGGRHNCQDRRRLPSLLQPAPGDDIVDRVLNRVLTEARFPSDSSQTHSEPCNKGHAPTWDAWTGSLGIGMQTLTVIETNPCAMMSMVQCSLYR